MRLDMTFLQLSKLGRTAYWNFVVDPGMPVTKDSTKFYLEQMLYNNHGQRVGQNLRPARLISKDKLLRKPSRIMSTVRDFRGYDQEDQACWTIETIDLESEFPDCLSSRSQIRS